MESAPHIEFQGMEASPEFRDKITHQLSRLEERFGRITACRVTVKAPSGHRHVGDPYEIKIHLSLPDEREVAVERTPHQDERFQALISLSMTRSAAPPSNCKIRCDACAAR